MRWVEHLAYTGEMRNTYRILVGKSETKRLLGRPRCRWRITLKRILRKWVLRVWTDWIYLTQVRAQCRGIVNTVMNV
jgi:hypothetical protein